MYAYEEFGTFQPCQADWHLPVTPNVLGTLARGSVGLGAEVGKAAAPQVAVGLPGSPLSLRRQVEASQPFPSPWAGPQLFLWLTQGLSRGRWPYMFIGGKNRWAWLCDVLVMASHLCSLVPGPFGDMSPFEGQAYLQAGGGARGEVGRVWNVVPEEARGVPHTMESRGTVAWV